MKNRFIPLFLLAATGCITVAHQPLPGYQEDWKLNPFPPDSVNVFLAGDEVPEECARIAIMNASGNDAWTTENQMLWELREKAGLMGGNAIAMPKTEEPSSGEKIVGAITGGGSTRKAESVLVYRCRTRRGDR